LITIVILVEFAAPQTTRSVSLEKNANTNDELSTKKNRPGFWEVPESSAKKIYVISHLQVSQIPKITPKKVNRNLECQQNDNIPRSICETSVKK